MQFALFGLMLILHSSLFSLSSSLPAAWLQVSPNKSQFFMYSTVTLSCKDQTNSSGWKVKRNTSNVGVRHCSSGWGSTSSGSTCVIGNIYPSDSGVYWCESDSGEHSNSVNITITDRTVALESPALPVSEGTNVTLRCIVRAELHNTPFYFYKDGHTISSSSTGEMTISNASRSDEGLYKCSISGGDESEVSWLAVEGSVTSPSHTQSSPATTASCSMSGFRLMCHLLVGAPYLLSTILLGLIYRDRQRAQTVTQGRGSNDVIMEISV